MKIISYDTRGSLKIGVREYDRTLMMLIPAIRFTTRANNYDIVVMTYEL